MTRIVVDSDQVLAANSTVQASIQQLQQQVDSLHGQLLNLQHSWQGQAANSFQELALRWRNTANLVDQQLAEIGKALALAAEQYRSTELANQRLFLG